MWWLAIPVVIGLTKVIYDAVTEEDKVPEQRKTTLELNFERLRKELCSHSGHKVAILGQPGAGKSSLLKKMTNGNVVPLPIIGTKTDATNWADNVDCSLLNHYKDYVFADVPGYDTRLHPTSVFSSSFPFEQFDAFVFVVHGKLHSSDEEIFRLVVRTKKKFFIAKSFLDGLENDELFPAENDIRMRLGLSRTVPIIFFSNRTGDGIDMVFNTINA